MAVAVVLAGGLGTRIRSVHPDLPKPLIPVAGAPFLAWVVRHLVRNGVRRVALSTGHRGELIEAWSAGKPVAGAELVCAREAQPLGTAGGFRHALDALGDEPDEPVVVVNGDSLVIASFAPLLAPLLDGIEARLLGVQVDDASRYGSLEVDAAGRLVSFRERRTGPSLINAGVYAFSRRAIARFPSRRPLSFEQDIFPELLSSRAVAVVPVSAPFIDIGIPEALATADDFVTRHFSA